MERKTFSRCLVDKTASTYWKCVKWGGITAAFIFAIVSISKVWALQREWVQAFIQGVLTQVGLPDIMALLGSIPPWVVFVVYLASFPLQVSVYQCYLLKISYMPDHGEVATPHFIAGMVYTIPGLIMALYAIFNITKVDKLDPTSPAVGAILLAVVSTVGVACFAYASVKEIVKNREQEEYNSS